MESYTFKTVTFGGFDKQDVARYMEQLTREHEEALAALQSENAALKEKNSHLEAENRSLRTQSDAQAASLSQLSAQAEKLLEEVAALRDYPEKYEALRVEAEAIRPDAEAYVEFRNRIGNIECEAQQRAAKLEADTQAQLRQMAESFRAQYEALTGSNKNFSADAEKYAEGQKNSAKNTVKPLPKQGIWCYPAQQAHRKIYAVAEGEQCCQLAQQLTPVKLPQQDGLGDDKK